MPGVASAVADMLKEGTKKRSALDISAEIEAVGGETNAFTTKEYTCYYARVLDADLPLAVDILTDLVRRNIISPAEARSKAKIPENFPA